MKTTTLRLQEDTLNSLDVEADERGISRSEYIREIIRMRDSAQENAERIQELETTVERLRNEKRLILEREQETQALAKQVDEQSHDSLGDRIRWLLFGSE